MTLASLATAKFTSSPASAEPMVVSRVPLETASAVTAGRSGFAECAADLAVDCRETRSRPGFSAAAAEGTSEGGGPGGGEGQGRGLGHDDDVARGLGEGERLGILDEGEAAI